MCDLVGQEMPPYLCFKAVQVPVQVLHEAVEPAVCLAVAAALHLHSALRTCRLTANAYHMLSATASCSELKTDPGRLTRPSQPLQAMRASVCSDAGIRLAITAALHLHFALRACWLNAHGTCSLSATPSCYGSHKAL